jgi:nitrite reductase (NADH) small subunit
VQEGPRRIHYGTIAMSSDASSNNGFTTVAKVGAIPEGEGASFQLGNRLVAVFNHQGKYLAIDDLCPHMGASLGAGCLDEEGVVTCPWHAWRFDATTGKWADNPRLSIDTFEVRVQGDEIQVRA